jgi:hypothetical protein
MAYRESGETRDLAIDPEEMIAAQTKSARKRLVGIAVALVVLASAGGTAAYVARKKSRAATQDAWDRFTTCMVGPLQPDDEKASTRVRNTQLVAMALPPERRSAPSEGAWPSRCSTYAHGVAEAIKASGASSTLADSSEKLGKAIAVDTAVTADLAPLVDKVFADAAAEDLV